MDLHGPRSGWTIPAEHLPPAPMASGAPVTSLLVALASAHSVLHPGSPGLHLPACPRVPRPCQGIRSAIVGL